MRTVSDRVRRGAAALAALVLLVVVAAGLTTAHAAVLGIRGHGLFAAAESRCAATPLPLRYSDPVGLGFYRAVDVNVPASCVGLDIMVTAYYTDGGGARASNAGGAPVRAAAAGWTTVPLSATYSTWGIFFSPTGFAVTVDSWGMPVVQPS